MEKRNYTYLGKNTIKGKTFVVLFTEEDTGVIVTSDFNDGDKFAFGKYLTNFAEEQFEILPPNMQVSLHN